MGSVAAGGALLGRTTVVFEGIDKSLKAWHIVVFIVLAVAIGAWTGLSTAPDLGDRASEEIGTEVSILDMRFSGYEYDEAAEFFTALGEDGRSDYATTFLIPDTLFAIVLFFAVGGLMIFLTRPGERFSVPLNEMVRLVIVALAFSAMAMDVLENIALWIALSGGEEPATGVVAAANLFTGVKWLALAGSFAALIATIIVALIRGTTSQTATA